jgi:RHS repeat-associated protein
MGKFFYPFGMIQPERTWESDKYRYGFNAKENDNEIKGVGNQQDYGMRIYDPRLGKFLSVDPLTKDFPWYTPYQFAGNKPIWAVDLDGLEEFFVTDYLDANNNLWKTEIVIATAAGAIKNSQIVHRSVVIDNGNGTFTINYAGSTQGTTTGQNAFANPNERQFALGIDNQGNPRMHTENTPSLKSVDVMDQTGATVQRVGLATQSTLTPSAEWPRYNKEYFDQNGGSLGVEDPNENGFVIRKTLELGPMPAGFTQQDKNINAVPRNREDRTNNRGSTEKGFRGKAKPQDGSGRTVRNL